MNGTDDQISAVQQTVSEVEQLILTLYQTSDAEERSRVDRLLIDLQRSQEGFQLADQLLQSSHEEVRFYGARTFIVKIHKDLESLEELARQELLTRLVHWLVLATDSKYGAATIRKICSAIVAFFTQTQGVWKSCVSDVYQALAANDQSKSGERALDESRLSQQKEATLLMFITSLLQEVTASDAEGPKAIPLHSSIEESVKFIMQILQPPLQAFVSNNGSVSIAGDAIDCYRALVMWNKAASRDVEVLTQVRPLASVVIELVVNEKLSGEASQLVFEVLADFATFFTQDEYAQLVNVFQTEQARLWLQQLVEGSFEDEPLWIGKLLVAYGEARVDTLATIESKENIMLLKQLLVPLTCVGVPASEDPMASPTLEFWSTFIETVRDNNEDHLHEPDRWLTWNDGLLRDLLLCVQRRVKHPNVSEWKSLTPDEKKLFSYFRSDARDLLGILEAFFGVTMATDVVGSIMKETPQGNWLNVEASFFCLNSVLSQVDYEDDILQQIASPLFQFPDASTSVIARIKSGTKDIPAVTFREVITFFSSIQSLAQHDSSLLVLIFQCLIEWFSLRALAMPAASVFAHICFHARDAVMRTNAYTQLLDLLQSYSSNPERDFTVREKVTGAVAAVAQSYAATGADEAGLITVALLDGIQHEIECGMQENDPEKNQMMSLSALRCLENMGKAFRVPETAIDLDEEEPPQRSNFWALNPEYNDTAQRRILNQCTAVLEKFSGPEEVTAVCHVLKSGYTENEVSPFVFPLEATSTMLKLCQLSTPSIGEVLKNVSVLLEKHRSRLSSELVLHFATECLGQIHSMVRPYFENDPSRDPEVASLVIDFLRSYTPAYNDILVTQTKHDGGLLEFAMACLASAEILPKQSAAIFWSRFVKGPPAKLEEDYCTIISAHSQRLVQVLVYQVGGAASRSDLEYFAEPIKAVVFKGGPFRNYMREAIAALDIPDNRVSETDKRVFFEKLFRWREDREDNSRILGSMSRHVRDVMNVKPSID